MATDDSSVTHYPDFHGDGHPLTTAGLSLSGTILWEFDGTEWFLKKDMSREGYGPSCPPTAPGRFVGQVRAVVAVHVEYDVDQGE